MASLGKNRHNVVNFSFWNYQPIFQHRINIVSTFWINVEMKQNPTSDFQRCITLIQPQYPTLNQHQNNVVQRRYNVVSTLFKRSLNARENYIESNRTSDDYGFINRLIIFILLNDKIFLLTIQLIMKYFKNYQQWYIL